jgi:hypothetical protein
MLAIQIGSLVVAGGIALLFSRSGQATWRPIVGIIVGIPVGFLFGVLMAALFGGDPWNLRIYTTSVFFSLFGAVGGAIYGRRLRKQAIDYPAPINQDLVYRQIAEELETGATDKGMWTRLFAECGGDEKQTKVLYIKQRADRLISTEKAGFEQAVRERVTEVEMVEKLRPPPSEAQQMEEHGIAFDGERYTYGEYKYDRLPDAISYAKLQNRRSASSENLKTLTKQTNSKPDSTLLSRKLVTETDYIKLLELLGYRVSVVAPQSWQIREPLGARTRISEFDKLIEYASERKLRAIRELERVGKLK